MDAADAVDKLSRVLGTDHERPEANAAVALLLQAINQDLRVLVVKRAENPTDSWSGQMALPGGKRDRQDRNLKDTVVREVFEEINVNVRDRCRYLGVLPPQRTKRRPELRILPFVILLEQEPSIRVNEGEVDQCMWVSLKELVHNEGQVPLRVGERPAYTIGTHVIWGLTYRILREFLSVLTARE